METAYDGVVGKALCSDLFSSDLFSSDMFCSVLFCYVLFVLFLPPFPPVFASVFAFLLFARARCATWAYSHTDIVLGGET